MGPGTRRPGIGDGPRLYGERLNLTYDVFDVFWWTLAATVLIVLLRDNQPRWWLAFGLVAGLGLLTKETILFWGFALVVGLLLTPQRRLLFTRWTLFGGLIAFALVLAIPALERRQWLGIVAVLGGLFAES